MPSSYSFKSFPLSSYILSVLSFLLAAVIVEDWEIYFKVSNLIIAYAAPETQLPLLPKYKNYCIFLHMFN